MEVNEDFMISYLGTFQNTRVFRIATIRSIRLPLEFLSNVDIIYS